MQVDRGSLKMLNKYYFQIETKSKFSGYEFRWNGWHLGANTRAESHSNGFKLLPSSGSAMAKAPAAAAPRTYSNNADEQLAETLCCWVLNITTPMLVVRGSVLITHLARNEFKVNDSVRPLPLNLTPKSKYTKMPNYTGL